MTFKNAILPLCLLLSGCVAAMDLADDDEDCARCDDATLQFPEPQTLDPARDAALIDEIGLLRTVPADLSRFNILVVGQDRESGAAARSPLPDGRARLASRADSITVVSVDRVQGEISLFAIYRGKVVPESCWPGTPPGASERYVANLYRFGGRRALAPCVADLMTSGLGLMGQAGDRFLDEDGRFEIHALVEADFNSFRTLLGEAAGNIRSYVSLAWTYRGHVTRLISTGLNRNAVLRTLRERNVFPAGGYQRSFHHMKFLATALGYVAFGAARDDGLLERGRGFYEPLSHSLPLAEVQVGLSLRGEQPVAGAIVRGGCFEGGRSPAPLYHFGSTFDRQSDYVVAFDGSLQRAQAKTSLLRSIEHDLDRNPARLRQLQNQVDSLYGSNKFELRFLPAPDDC